MARMPSDRHLAVAKATVDDLDAIEEIERVSFPTPWSRQALAEELDRPWSIFRVLKGPGGALLAYLNYWVVYDEVHVLNVATHPGHRQRGYARLLLDQMIRLARQNDTVEIHLEVRPSNRAARLLYVSLGFVEVGVRQGYYPDSGEDALLYALVLRKKGSREKDPEGEARDMTETTPGTATPGTATRGTATPGTATPGTATRGTATPGTATPGTATPGTTTPGTATRGTTTRGKG